MKAKGSPKATLKRTLTVILAAAAIVSAGNYADTPFTAATVQAATKKPAAVKNLRATKTTKKAITVKWTKEKNAVRYNVQVWKGSKCLKNKKTKTNTLRVAGLSAGTTYTVKVTNFVKVNRQQVASAVATLKVKTKAAAASAPQEPSVPDVPSTPGTEPAAPDVPDTPQEPDTELPPVISVIPDTPPAPPVSDDEEETENVKYVSFGSETVAMSESYYEAHHTAYDSWRDEFISNCITDGMTDIEKCNQAGYYIDQKLDYSLDAHSNHVPLELWSPSPDNRPEYMDCNSSYDPYKCFENGIAVCYQSNLILGDFLAHMGIESQYRTLPQKNHGNLWAMLDGQAFIVDGTVSKVSGAAYLPALELTTLPKHCVYSEDMDAGTCTVELMDGTEQTFTYEEAFPTGWVPGAPAGPDDPQ